MRKPTARIRVDSEGGVSLEVDISPKADPTVLVPLSESEATPSDVADNQLAAG